MCSILVVACVGSGSCFLVPQDLGSKENYGELNLYYLIVREFMQILILEIYPLNSVSVRLLFYILGKIFQSRTVVFTN